MRLKIVSQRQLDNTFELVVLDSLQGCALEGIATNNVLIPHISLRNLPNEHDLLVLTRGRVYTLDTKALKAGYYRGPSGGDWEYSLDRTDWKSCTFTAHPRTIAFKKGRAVETFIRENLAKGDSMPEVVSVIVVPDEANVEELGWRDDGTTETGARLLLASRSELCGMLEADSQAHPQRNPSVKELADLFGVEQTKDRRTLPCYLDEHLRVDAFLARLQLPVLRYLYRGYHGQWRRPVRIEVLPKFNAPESVEEQIRAFRSNILALQDLRHEAILRLHGHHDTPTSLIVVSELFSELTLMDVIEERRLNWEEARQVFRPVADLLQHAHENGIVHRYLDPTCILLKEGDFTKVRVQGFFGAVVGGLTTVRGGKDNRGRDDEQEETSNPFLSPERHKGEQRRGPLQDAYSVGRCLAAALTGSPLRLPTTKEVPAEVEGVIAQLVSWVPEERAPAWARLRTLLA